MEANYNIGLQLYEAVLAKSCSGTRQEFRFSAVKEFPEILGEFRYFVALPFGKN